MNQSVHSTPSKTTRLPNEEGLHPSQQQQQRASPQYASLVTPSSPSSTPSSNNNAASSQNKDDDATLALCTRRRTTSICSCKRARFRQRCPQCHHWFGIGDCITQPNTEPRNQKWTHTECPGWNDRRENRTVLPRRRLFAEDEENETGTTSLVISLTIPVGPSYKKAKYDNLREQTINSPPSSSIASSSPVTKNSRAAFAFTSEQQRIVNHVPKPGEIVRIQALAGTGKTTTLAAVCRRLLQAQPSRRILYLVFNKRNQQEAVRAKTFPEGVQVLTTHAYALRTIREHLKGYKTASRYRIVNEYNLERIIQQLSLRDNVEQRFPQLTTEQQRECRVRAIARILTETLERFQQSSDRRLSHNHVPHRTAIHSWSHQVISPTQWVTWAQTIFDRMHNALIVQEDKSRPSGKEAHDSTSITSRAPPWRDTVNIPHDAYVKVAQVEQLVTQYDVLLLDEAQDMTECQADFLWGPHVVQLPSTSSGQQPIVYLVGDQYQQLYRFRGACDAFVRIESSSENTSSAPQASTPSSTPPRSTPKTSQFTLTGSFRFGPIIADCATIPLSALQRIGKSGESKTPTNFDVFKVQSQPPIEHTCDKKKKETLVLQGLSDYAGKIEDVSSFSSGVVLCRTNAGMMKYLAQYKPKCWRYLDQTMKPPSPNKVEKWMLDLEKFVNGTQSTFQCGGHMYSTVEEILECTSVEEENNKRSTLELLISLKGEHLSLREFRVQITQSFSSQASVVLSTVHKAKGMEFESVLTWDDYNVNAILSDTVNRLRRQDELNILYVAISRTKRTLYLTKKIKSCLEQLQAKLDKKEAIPREQSLERMREKWDQAWKCFERSSAPICSVYELPFPGNDRNPLSLDPLMTESEQRWYIQLIRSRLHPVGFFPRFQDRLENNMILRLSSIRPALEALMEECLKTLLAFQSNID